MNNFTVANKLTISKILYLFDNKIFRNIVVGTSFALHLIAGLSLFCGPNRDAFLWFQIPGSLTLIPIVFLAENYKKIVLYLIFTQSPFPVLLGTLMSLVSLLSYAESSNISKLIDHLSDITTTFGLIYFMFFMVVCPFIVGSVILRFGLRRRISRN